MNYKVNVRWKTMPWKGPISFNHRCQEFILVLKSFCQEFLWIHFSPNIVSFQSRFVGYLEKVFTKLNGRLPASVSYRIKNIKIDAISGRGNVYSCNNILMENFSDYYSIWYNRKFSQQINHLLSHTLDVWSLWVFDGLFKLCFQTGLIL